MKKTITITEMSLVTRTIEVEVPSYYNKFGQFIAITDDAVTSIYEDLDFFRTPASKEKRYNEAIADALKYNPPTISKELFEKRLQKTIKCLTEQYQLSINMVLDPNNAQAQPANEEAIAEQAAATTDTTTQAIEETGDAVAAE